MCGLPKQTAKSRCVWLVATLIPLLLMSGCIDEVSAPEICRSGMASARLELESPKDSTVFSPGSSFQKSWTLSNQSNCSFDKTFRLVYSSSSGPRLSTAPDQRPLGGVVGPTQTFTVVVPMTAPTTSGLYREDWQLVDGSGVVVPIVRSSTMWAIIRVRP